MGGTKITQAVILAGGMGIRLRPYTYENPKAIVPVNNQPFLAYLIDMLKENGIEEIVMLLGYLPEKITEYLGDGSKFGVKVKYSKGSVDDWTGTRIRNAKDLLADRFLALYCDNYLHLDLPALVAFHEAKKAVATMTIYTNEYGFTKNNVFVDAEGYVVKFDKTRTDTGLNGVDLGFFIFEKEILKYMPEGNFWLDEHLFPPLIATRNLAGFTTNRLYYSLGDAARLERTEHFLGPQKVVFLDRDGVINKKMPTGEYVRNVEKFEFLPKAKEAMKHLADAGYKIYIISNQAGIGRGLMNEGDLFQIHKYMEGELAKEGVHVAGIYHCPHRADENCKCRKPKPGMLFQAAIEHHIDLPRATFIGDDPRDAEAGVAAGCKTILMEPDGDLLKTIQPIL